MEKYDFSGWATRNNLKCSDGRTIMKDAFKHNDGQVVPLVWGHQHDDPMRVLGHALLENRDEGVYTYCKFNDTEQGQNAKQLVEHGDVVALSIYANQLQQRGGNVLHGAIREVSLVLAGANPGAYIDSVMKHGEESDEEAIIYTGEDISLAHEDEEQSEDESLTHASDDKQADENGEGANESEDEETVEEIFNSLNEKQKNAVYYMIGQALQHSDEDEENENETIEGGNNTMKHNVFDNDSTQAKRVLSHDDMKSILDNAKRFGSVKESFNDFIAHAEGDIEIADKTQNYGINGTDFLFPEAHNLNNPPEFIKRETGWVTKVMNGVHKSPFSRIKSMFADITEDDARAKGYIKGKLKKEEVFGLLKRTTTPTTIYKKQKMDRDDIIDITDFDVVAWLKSEMRLMLDEEIARAILVGDGRSTSSDDKINEINIRPIWTDEDLFTIKTPVKVKSDATADEKVKAFIRAVVKSRKNYKGSGEPTLYTTEDLLTDCLLLEDGMGRVIYDSVTKLAAALRVKDIVTVPVMEGLKRDSDDGEVELMGIIVNLKDYNVGADKGGAVNMFDDFDIDYNQQKYLIETRCSGALTKPFSAMAIELSTTAV